MQADLPPAFYAAKALDDHQPQDTAGKARGMLQTSLGVASRRVMPFEDFCIRITSLNDGGGFMQLFKRLASLLFGERVTYSKVPPMTIKEYDGISRRGRGVGRVERVRLQPEQSASAGRSRWEPPRDFKAADDSALLRACLGDRGKADRLIDYEVRRSPGISRQAAIDAAMDRLQADRR